MPQDRIYHGQGVPRTPREGRILVHNHVQHEVNTPVGERGFRAWWQLREATEPPLVLCDCGWAPDISEHYRVDLDKQRGGEEC